MSTVAREAITPPKGQAIYDTDLNKGYLGDGATAGGVEIGSGGGGGGGSIGSSQIIDLEENDQEIIVAIPEGSVHHVVFVYCNGFETPSFVYPVSTGEGKLITVVVDDLTETTGDLASLIGGGTLLQADYAGTEAVSVTMVDTEDQGWTALSTAAWNGLEFVNNRVALGVGIVDQWTGSAITTVATGDINIVYKARYAMRIDKIDIKTSSGTCTANVKINGTNVTGLASLAVSSTNRSDSASGSDNLVAVGDQIVLNISANSSGSNLLFNLQTTRV